ncbi:GNAT family N-acetyltransferase, partial [bacterium]|nr:GNAT family N-acetyltransferase [bacterium]
TLAELEFLNDRRPDDVRTLLAENDGELVGGVLLFRASSEMAMSFYTARSDSPRAERCMNLLMEHALHAGRDWGCAFLDYGTSSIGGVLNEGLAHFKERFGGLPHLRETWRLDL